MKYKVQLLNYDSEWVNYCNAQTLYNAECAVHDLKYHGFEDYQIKMIPQ